jgi:hypothetical protein
VQGFWEGLRFGYQSRVKPRDIRFNPSDEADLMIAIGLENK